MHGIPFVVWEKHAQVGAVISKASHILGGGGGGEKLKLASIIQEVELGTASRKSIVGSKESAHKIQHANTL